MKEEIGLIEETMTEKNRILLHSALVKEKQEMKTKEQQGPNLISKGRQATITQTKWLWEGKGQT